MLSCFIVGAKTYRKSSKCSSSPVVIFSSYVISRTFEIVSAQPPCWLIPWPDGQWPSTENTKIIKFPVPTSWPSFCCQSCLPQGLHRSICNTASFATVETEPTLCMYGHANIATGDKEKELDSNLHYVLWTLVIPPSPPPFYPVQCCEL